MPWPCPALGPGSPAAASAGAEGKVRKHHSPGLSSSRRLQGLRRPASTSQRREGLCAKLPFPLCDPPWPLLRTFHPSTRTPGHAIYSSGLSLGVSSFQTACPDPHAHPAMGSPSALASPPKHLSASWPGMHWPPPQTVGCLRAGLYPRPWFITRDRKSVV